MFDRAGLRFAILKDHYPNPNSILGDNGPLPFDRFIQKNENLTVNKASQ